MPITLGRGTTPLYIISISGIDVSDISDVYITFEQKGVKKITKHFPEAYIEDDKFKIRLTQEETLSFNAGTANAQVRFITQDDTAYKSDTFCLQVTDALYDEVI